MPAHSRPGSLRVLPALVLALALLVGGGWFPAAAGEAEPLPERTITSRVTDKKNVLTLRGAVDPGHEQRIVRIQKRACGSCGWFTYRKVRTDERARFAVRIDAPRKGSWFWRAKVREYGGYATSYSQVWRTWTD